MPLIHPRGLIKGKFDEAHLPGYLIARTSFTGLGTSYGANILTCASDQVFLIDEVMISGITGTTAANVTCTVKVNDIELPFHLPGTANLRRSDRISWRTKGNLVIQPGKGITAKASAANTMMLEVRGRMVQVSSAYAGGDLVKSMPNVCSTNTVTGGGTSDATAKQILAPVTGYSVEVLGFALTGHNYNTAADSIRLGFWDGTTGGSFASGGKSIFIGYGQGASAFYAPKVLIGDTKGCIQGPSGYGLYIQASTNFAGVTPPADYNVIYRLVPTTEVASTGGVAGGVPASMGKFWVTTNAAISAAGTSVPWFDNATVWSTTRIFGYAGSCTTGNGVASAVVGIGVGPDHQGSIVPYEILNSDGAGAPAAVSRTWFKDDFAIVTHVAQAPGFVGLDALSINTNRFQLAWGRFDADQSVTYAYSFG